MPVRSTARRVRQKAKGPIDPALGQRIRDLRLARGLTQRQLAGSDFTPGFISLLETGLTRASLRAAEIIAGRLGVAVSELVQVPIGRDQRSLELEFLGAQRSLAAGEAESALRMAETVMQRTTGVLRTRVQRLSGQALLQLGRPREAARVLDEARRAFRSNDQVELAARTTLELARAHGALGELAEATGLALECERLLESRTVVDRTFELQVTVFLAAMFIEVGEVHSADVRAGRAMAIAEDVNDPAVTALMYAGLAITRQQQGDLEAALVAARKSLDAYERLGQEREVAEAWNTLAWLQVERKQFGRAAEALQTATKLATSTAHERLLAMLDVTAAELAIGRRQYAEAVVLTDAAAKKPGASSYARAEALFVRAQALAAQRPAVSVVRKAYDAALAAFATQPARRRAKVHQAYAAELAERNLLRDAYEQSQLALRCMDARSV
jgi:transcriptional regulator with XRE-family HTH domain